jgi:8-oxo-dGTP pyrophosphatase MutT (NUDIX family)
VAAVCYRLSGVSVEFLLVNTSAGKWTFPKGRIDPLLSPSESAAQEALEEAGAMGLIEPAHFASYLDRKRVAGQESLAQEITIAAYLLEVRRRVVPEEADRNPTWFTAQETKRRLSEKRAPRHAAMLQGVIDLAVERVSRRVGPVLRKEFRPRLQVER